MAGIFSDGNGTKENPFIVKSVADLNNMHNNIKAFYKQGNDIDFAGGEWTPLGKGEDKKDIFYMFSGGYDGAGFVISNVVYKSTPDMKTEKPGEEGKKSVAGFFGSGHNCILENITIENARNSERSALSVGGVIGALYGGSISNCGFSGVLNSIGGYTYNMGGIAGQAIFSGTQEKPSPVKITGCNSNVLINGTGNVGGLVGDAYYTEIKKSFSVGVINAEGSAGGFGGNVQGLLLLDNNFNFIRYFRTIIDECYSSVELNTADGGGGFADNLSRSEVVNCYSDGSITATGANPFCGGFAGRSEGNIYRNCYSSSAVSALGEQVDPAFGYLTSAVSGFVGFAGETIIDNCFALNKAVEARSRSNSIIGFTREVYEPNEITNCFHLSTLSFDSSQSTKITEKEAMKEETFIFNGWDFRNKWYIEEGVRFPDFVKRSKSRVKCKRMFIGNLLGG